MVYWQAALLATSVLTLGPYEKYIVGLKTPHPNLGKRNEGNSVLGWALELAQAYDPDGFIGSAVSTITHEYDLGHGVIGFAILTTPQAKEALARHPNVAHCERDQEIAPHSPTPWIWNSQTEPPRYLWHLDRINKPEISYDGKYPVIGNQGKGVTVYLMDGGIDRSHPEFEDRAIEGVSIVDGTVEQLKTLNSDTLGHGTHCAGVIAGKSVGIAPKARVMAVKILGRNGKGHISDMIEALEYINKNAVPGKSVVSISLGSKCKDPTTKLLIPCNDPVMIAVLGSLINKGIPVVTSAGNGNINTCYTNPGAYHTLVFSVGATNVMDFKVPDSNHGSCLTMFAPGWLIKSTYLNRRYVAKTGTSFAAPIVAGVFAALLSTYSYASTSALYKQVIDWSLKDLVTGIPNNETPNRLLFVPF